VALYERVIATWTRKAIYITLVVKKDDVRRKHCGMQRRLPSLNALRVFEATARHCSMSRAAEELHVTHGAVSRHIAKLEDFLGTRLFDRRAHQLKLTPQAAAYAARIKEMFDSLEQATLASFDNTLAGVTLQANVPTTFATRWLVPRLGHFARRHPKISVQVTSVIDESMPDFERSDVDIVICRRGDWQNLYSCPLFDEILVPVASPSLTGPLSDVDDLGNFVLLHSQHRVDDWGLWLRTAGATRVDPHSGVRLGNSQLAYEGAIYGLGIALAQLAYIHDDLKEGRLIAVFKQKLRTNCYYAVCPASKVAVPKIAAFLSWLKEEAERFNYEHPTWNVDGCPASHWDIGQPHGIR
jgi:LysR family glycine cleavage system transcriptional activator